MSKFDEFYPYAAGKVWDKYGNSWYIDEAGDKDCHYAGQCVSLIKTYLIYLYGADQVRDTYGDAIDYWTNCETNGILELCDIAHEMQDGDIIVTLGTNPEYGHIFIYRAGEAFTQNFGGDPRALVKPLSQQGKIVGILRPKCLVSESAAASDKEYGLDLSQHNPKDLDFNRVKAAGNSFVILRAGYGWSMDQKDPHFDAYYARAKAAGLKVGAYWYSYARNLDEAKAEAECFKKAIAGKDFDFGVWADLEDADGWKKANGNPSGELQAACVNLIIQEMRAAGYTCGVYASTWWIDNIYTGLDTSLLWEANYGAGNLSRPHIHQYTSSWQMDGRVYDRNVLIRPFTDSKPKPTPQPAGSIHRLYNPANGDHLYTPSYDEAQKACESGWNYEGIGWVAPASGTPIYRMLNPNDGTHAFGPEAERDGLIKAGWKCEGIAFYSGGNHPLYRMYNPNSGAHIFSADRKEHDALTRCGWVCEGQELRY